MQLLETIKCLDGKLYNMKFHQERFDLARRECFASADNINLSELIQVSEEHKSGLFRCRVLYRTEIEKIEFIPHQYRRIASLKLIEDNEINYSFKLSNRAKLDSLYQQRGQCDDILIVKNASICDSYTANIIFFDGNKWWTPDTPLLSGTQRARLISENKISVKNIGVNNLGNYKKVGLINAMWDMENMPVIDISNILK